jgi:hypothetical protein
MESTDYKYMSYTVDTIDYKKETIKTKTYVSNDVTYNIINNDSNYLSFDDKNMRLYRSLITDELNNILCFSPPNSVTIEHFKASNPILTDSVYANEIIEGTMINLFFDKRINKWEISTRGAVGGNYWYYRTQYYLNDDSEQQEVVKQKTFRQMFLEAICASDDTLESSPLLEYLPKNNSYSFVMQHKENHIVMPIEGTHLFLVSVYTIGENNVTFIPPTIYENWDFFANGTIEFPKRFVDNSYEELQQKFGSIHSDYSTMGVMFTNIHNGDRAAMQNPVYEDLKKLRGNNPNLQYQYFCLARVEQKNQFLEQFPIYKKLFNQFGKQYQDFVTNVHQSYFSYYVKKEGIQIAKKFFIHASKIHHQIYLPSLSEQKIIITRGVVKDYFDALTPSEILYYLNYDKRQVTMDRKKNDENNSKLQEDVSDDSDNLE